MSRPDNADHSNGAELKARAMNRDAEILRRAGHFAEAEPLYRSALAIHARHSAPTSVSWAICRDNFGTLLAETGRLSEAVEQHRQALVVFRAYPNHPVDIAICASNLGQTYALLGNQDGAVRYLREAKRLHEEAGHLGLDYAGTLTGLARLERDPAMAEQLLRHALAVCADAGPGSEEVFITATNSLGALLTMDGRYDEAQELLEPAAGLAEVILGAQHPCTVLATANLAELRRRIGDLDRAQAMLESLIEGRLAAGEAMSPVVEAMRTSLARVHEARGRLTQAAPQLAANVQSEMLRTSEMLRSATQAEHVASLRINLEHLVTFLGFAMRQHAQLPALAPMALEFWVQRKRLAVDVLAAYRAALATVQLPEVTAQLSRLAELRAQIDEEIRISSSRFVRSMSEWIARTSRLAELRGQADEIERAIAPTLQGLHVDAIVALASAESIAGSLPANCALLECCALLPQPGEPPGSAGRQPVEAPQREVETGYLVFVVRGDESGRVRMVDLGPASRLERLVTEFRNALGAGPASRDLSLAESTDRTTGDLSDSLRQRLETEIGNPLRREVAGVERLIVCPDSVLCLLPFHALSSGPKSYWIDDFEISYLPSARDLLRPDPSTAPPARSGPVVIAAPQFSIDLSADGPYQPLEGARREGSEVAARLGGELLLGPAATKSAITAVAGPAVLHIATHGFFDAGISGLRVLEHETAVTDNDDPYADPEFNRLARLVGADSREPVKSAQIIESSDLSSESTDLLLSSGLAMAGANDAWQQRHTARTRTPEQVDYGELLAVDLARLDLVGTSMVVLSACDTGLGNVIAGEGVWGLQLAVQLAGAAALVMSLWRVDDETTVDLMCDFYDRVLAGDSKGAALRAASLTLRQRHSHPRFWAPFLCLGDSGPLPVALTRAKAPSQPH
jgi:CHAT domain-containing protein/tetratricopeptide (TPR) repeat protein